MTDGILLWSCKFHVGEVFLMFPTHQMGSIDVNFTKLLTHFNCNSLQRWKIIKVDAEGANPKEKKENPERFPPRLRKYEQKQTIDSFRVFILASSAFEPKFLLGIFLNEFFCNSSCTVFSFNYFGRRSSCNSIIMSNENHCSFTTHLQVKAWVSCISTQKFHL